MDFRTLLAKIRGVPGSPGSEPTRGPLYAAVRDALANVQDYARSHGGTIDLVEVTDEGEVIVRMRGTCNGCPLADLTLKQGVEGQLRILVPGVTKVTRIR